MLSSMVVQRLRNDVEKKQNSKVAVLCIFLNYKESKRQTVNNLLGSLLKQLVQVQGDHFRSARLRQIWEDSETETPPAVSDLEEVLHEEIQNYTRVYLIVDALDECPSKVEPLLMEKLRNLPSEKMSIMVTARPLDEAIRTIEEVYCSVCKRKPLQLYYRCEICDGGTFDLCQSCKDADKHCRDRSHTLSEPYSTREINVEPSRDEIRQFVEHSINVTMKTGTKGTNDPRFPVSQRGTTFLGRLCLKVPSLKDEILSTIPERADGQFLLAKLYLDALEVKVNEKDVRDLLADLPKDFNVLYEQVMERINTPINPDDNGPALARKMLSWIVCTHRPLTLMEMQDALAIDPKDTKFNATAVCDKVTLLEKTAGLVTVASDVGEVRLVHLTAQAYFERQRERWFQDADLDIALVALHYLSYEDVSDTSVGGDQEDEEFNAKKNTHPFLSYASQYWGDHAYAARRDPRLQSAVVEFLSNSQKVASAVLALWYLDSTSSASWDLRRDASGLHVAAWFGLAYAIPDLHKDFGMDVNYQDPKFGQTSLMYACRRGHVETVLTLLNLGANPNIRSASRSTALFEAVLNNRTEVVKVLLESKKMDINAGQELKGNSTALMFAAQGGYSSIVDEILKRPDLDINQKDLEGYTALSRATMSGYSNIVESLLKHDNIDINAVSSSGNSPLILAAKWGRDDTTDILLRNGADPSIKDHEGGGTALLRAIDEGQTSVVNTILKYEDDVLGLENRCRDELGRGLVHGASVNGQTEIVRSLVEKGLDVNAEDKSGKTPLHDASRSGEPNVTIELLQLGADPSIEDKLGRTPWKVAWQNGELAVMNILEGNFEDPQDYSQYPDVEDLPIWSLTKLGRKDLISAKIASKSARLFDVNPDNSDTAVHCAVECDEMEILELLLDAGMSPDSTNDYVRTPLHVAATCGNVRATEILLKHNAKVDILDRWCDYPLNIAQAGNQLEIALDLIEAKAIIDPQKIAVQDLFFAAVEFNRSDAVKILLDNGASPLAKNVVGKSALKMAKELGHKEIESLMKGNKSFFHSISIGSQLSDDDEFANMILAKSPFRRPELFLDEKEDAVKTAFAYTADGKIAVV